MNGVEARVFREVLQRAAASTPMWAWDRWRQSSATGGRRGAARDLIMPFRAARSDAEHDCGLQPPDV